MRKTNIKGWTEEWAKSYRKEEEVLNNIFSDDINSLFHIGSTSISAIGFAKPIIDMLMVVRDIERVDAYNEKLIALGYTAKGENGITGRRYFTKGAENRTHHLHIFQRGNEHIDIHLTFKAYLLQHPKDAREYGEHKLQLAKQFPENHHQYQQAKQQYADELVKKANEWAMYQRKL